MTNNNFINTIFNKATEPVNFTYDIDCLNLCDLTNIPHENPTAFARLMTNIHLGDIRWNLFRREMLETQG